VSDGSSVSKRLCLEQHLIERPDAGEIDVKLRLSRAAQMCVRIVESGKTNVPVSPVFRSRSTVFSPASRLISSLEPIAITLPLAMAIACTVSGLSSAKLLRCK